MLKVNHKYDERQQLERGKAFRNAYLTIAVVLLVCFFINDCLELFIFNTYFMFLVSFWLSAVAFFVTAIVKDAYDTISKDNGGAVILTGFGVAGLVLIIFECSHMIRHHESLLVNGVVNHNITQIIPAICMLMISAAYWIKHWYNLSVKNKIDS